MKWNPSISTVLSFHSSLLQVKLMITACDTKIFHFGNKLCCSQLIKHLRRWRGIYRTTCTLKTAFPRYFTFHNITWHCLTESNSIYLMCYYQLIPYEVIRNLSAWHAIRTADDLHLCRNLPAIRWNETSIGLRWIRPSLTEITLHFHS